MKTWLVGLSLIGCVTCTTGTVLADDGQVQHSASPVHTNLHPVTADVQNTDGHSIHQWDVKSSVQVSRETLRDAYNASHQAYTKKLEKYAKCSEKDAKKAIISEHPGMTIEEFQLRNIRTSLVYMAIARDDEDKYLVIVDAGNGHILLDKRVPTHNERVFANHDPGSSSEE
ncbi:hypothetical protein [Alicyclobacillus dauci]|uniref:Peptidase propeptide and YPEB domain-containing protein n=1 Tax=Alicyclobacillus dauci TaxID=1475485 RepID=A0ABY6Z5R3_9BACL|nr:hypothetical protein [Alicyclobacillus dauci]WAH38205.1 hypothetical protein NZD86_06890 [Alicyclobacillus dauci]